MGRIWVLDTETKGTGAQMVPLETVLKKPAPSDEPFFVPRKPTPRQPEPEPRQPRAFKIVDVVTREVLAEDAGAREALNVLNGVRSIVDVHVFAWEPQADKWRLLTLDEQRVLWDVRSRAVSRPRAPRPGPGDR